MKVLYGEDIASRTGPESWGAAREDRSYRDRLHISVNSVGASV